MSLSRLATASFIALGLAGCASAPPQYMVTPFLDGDFQTWTQSGPYTVTGQAFVKLPDGHVITCAGGEISLLPAVGYNTELEQLLQNGKGIPVNYDRHARKYEHKTICDSTGHFSFDGIPALNWVVLTRVSWQEPSSIPYLGPEDKGGYLFGEIQVRENRTSLTLTNPDFVADAK
ncbi:hypothetical protein FHS83_002925 [Rhizomicrobium palustre]|uniref:Lipoprotein n=1 Tax=Rhizomicrobium palustre TaxID=189966 RepID=A0A846N3B9_9PROT|nr:hypothetical protein [Rhizomicrobium palustre]NIK89607.1 hypothetical protein [Rhizomicrobium palustre]